MLERGLLVLRNGLISLPRLSKQLRIRLLLRGILRLLFLERRGLILSNRLIAHPLLSRLLSKPLRLGLVLRLLCGDILPEVLGLPLVVELGILNSHAELVL